MTTLDQVITIWSQEEQSIEVKFDTLRDHILSDLGFQHEIEYYKTNGYFWRRYLAGFINRFFILLKDFSYIVLDPLHIIDIIKGFVKSIVMHPLKTFKQIFVCWTKIYRNGPFGFGALTADALVATLFATAISSFTAPTGINTTTAFSDTIANRFVRLPRELSSLAASGQEVIAHADDFFQALVNSPQNLLTDANMTMTSGIAYGFVRKFKKYNEQLVRSGLVA